jgi:translation initiation factor 4E
VCFERGNQSADVVLLPPSNAMATAKSWLAAAAAPVRPAERGELALHTPFHFSYLRRGATSREENYGSSIKEIASFATVEHFWSCYNHVLRPAHLSPLTDIFLFRHGVQPMWEDEANALGGRLSVRVRKHVSSKAFEDLVLAMIGEQFDTPEFICGLACSVRYQEDILSIWLKTSDNQAAIASVANVAKRVLNLPPAAVTRGWDFKAHNS